MADPRTKFKLPLPNSNDLAEINRVLRVYASRISDLQGGQTIIQQGGSAGSGATDFKTGSDANPPEVKTDYLLWQEKPGYNRWKARITAEDTVLRDNCTKANLTTANCPELVAYNTAYNNFNSYITDTAGFIYSVGGKQFKVAGWSVEDQNDLYLGPGGRKNWDAYWEGVDSAAAKLRDAITNKGLDPGDPSDVMRNILYWDFAGATLPTKPTTGNSYQPAVPGPTSVTNGNSSLSTIESDTATRLTATGGAGVYSFLSLPTNNAVYQTLYNGAYGGTPSQYTTGIPTREGYLVAARVRWNKVAGNGNWTGKVAYITATGSGNKTISAPVEGAWVIKVWDLRTVAGYMTTGNIQSFVLELVDQGATCDVDWIGLAKYGAGSRDEYDNLVSYLTTLSMMKADFVDPSTGLIPADTKIKPDSITSPLIAGNQIFAKHMTIGNFDNLVINGNSQYVPNPDWVSMGGTNAGIEGIRVFAGTGYGSTSRCRRIVAETVIITNDIPVAVGDVYAAYAFTNNSASTGTLIVETYNGTTWTAITFPGGTGSSSGTGWVDANIVGNSFTIPNGATHMRVKLSATGTSYFDNIYLRKCADSRLLIDGGILARHIATGALEGYHFRVGPMYQFQSRASGGAPLILTNDGAFKRAASDAEYPGIAGLENASDATYYADGSRVHQGASDGQPNRFEATFYGSNVGRSIIAALGSAYGASGLAGLELRRTSTGIRLYKVSGVGSYTAFDGAETAVSDPGSGYEKMSLVLYNPTSTASGALRAEAYINGKLIKQWTRGTAGGGSTFDNAANFGSGSLGGYAAVRLADTSTRFGMVAYGGGNVVIEDGIVMAKVVQADLIQTSNYAEDGFGNATAGAKMGLSGATEMKVGPNGIRIGKAIFNQSSLYFNRIRNHSFFKATTSTSTPTVTGTEEWIVDNNDGSGVAGFTPVWLNVDRDAGSTYAAQLGSVGKTQGVAGNVVTWGSATYSGNVSQIVWSVPAPVAGYAPTLTFSTLLKIAASNLGSGDNGSSLTITNATIKVYIQVVGSAEVLVATKSYPVGGGSGQWPSIADLFAGNGTKWVDESIDLSSYITAACSFKVRFLFEGFQGQLGVATVAGTTTNPNVSIGIDRISFMG